MTDATGTSTWKWDSLGRLVSTRDGYGSTVTYGYDLARHLTRIDYPGTGGGTVTRHFDPAGRMDSLTDWRSNRSTFAYGADSNLARGTLPAGTGLIDSYGYNNAGALTSISTKRGATTLADFAYTRDGVGQLATSVTTGITELNQAYGYTQLRQLRTSGPSGTPVTYAYDTSDNLTARGNVSTLAYDVANQLCWQQTTTVATPTCASPPARSTTFAYDGAGNRTRVTTGAGVSTTYGYDGADRLTRAGSSASYVYDGTGLRLSKTVSRSTTRQVWDRSGGLEQLLGDGSNYYVYGPDGLPFEQISTGGTLTYLHHDQLGSTRLLTNTSGANVGTYNFDPYGRQTAHTGSATTPLLFAGQYTDSESGLIYMRARYYDPETGQFISRDPLEADTGQPYSYALDNPLAFTDPTGLDFLDALGNFAAGFGDAATDSLVGVAESANPFVGLFHDLGAPLTTREQRSWLGIDDAVEYDSGSYGWGGTAFDAWSCAVGGAGSARALGDAGYYVTGGRNLRRGGRSLVALRNRTIPGRTDGDLPRASPNQIRGSTEDPYRHATAHSDTLSHIAETHDPDTSRAGRAAPPGPAEGQLSLNRSKQH